MVKTVVLGALSSAVLWAGLAWMVMRATGH